MLRSPSELIAALRERAPLAYEALSALEGCSAVTEEESEGAADQVQALGDKKLYEFFGSEAVRLLDRNERLSDRERTQRRRAYVGEALSVLRRAEAPRRATRVRLPRCGRAPRRRVACRAVASRDGPSRSSDDDPDPDLDTRCGGAR